MIPKDPVMLLSYTNTKLRDSYNSLEEFCQSQDVDRQMLEETLSGIDYHYDQKQNQFI
ncbi:MAG: DUF4250 domain-containing protein [Lachnospiraceae bacterium]|nr:DUF4250 domain-containing protein [Lachnospiraceae bacterium]MCI9152009.1 DUF4250 domain-containing protein [Lachnospiraceae bacterium]